MLVKFSCDKGLVGVIPNPDRAIKFAPSYYKQTKPQSSESPKTGTVKRCVPFLDALSAGFIIPMWCDVYVVARGGEFHIDFPPNYPLKDTFGTHSEKQFTGHPLQNKPYGKIPMKWMSPWIVETETNVSCMFVSPLNHIETRFKLLDGVVDTDTYYNNINFPFLWTGGDGEFFIAKGTPLVQVIPFRREAHGFEVSAIDPDRRSAVLATLGTKLKNGYRDELRHGNKAKPSDDLEVLVGQVKDHPQVEVDNDAPPADRVEALSSGILEVVADDTERGFGEGSF